MPTPGNASNLWLGYALLTVLFWGLYGVFLHSGQMAMGDPANGRYKAFLVVGIAYFLTAVVSPLVLLFFNDASWAFSGKGIAYSLAAGIVGAGGAFCVLLAFGSGGTPSVVMSIIFAGAPVINAFVALTLHPPSGGLKAIRFPFVLGILLAAVGGFLVTQYKPLSSSSKSPPASDHLSPGN